MPHIKTNHKYYTEKQFVIYAIYFSFGKQVYVGKTLKHAVKSHYKDHYILRNSLTKHLFMEAESNSVIPNMYLLEELNTTEAQAYRHCVAWVRYFQDQGYECVAHPGTRDYANHLWQDTKEIYENIRMLSPEDVLHEDRVLVSSIREYRRTKTEKNDDEYAFIGFRVTQDDAEKIRLAAEKKQQSVSEYCRAAAVDGCIVNVDYNFLWRYMGELAHANRLLDRLICTIHETGTYHPQDLANIQKVADTVVAHQKSMNKDMTAVMKKAQKEIRAAKRYLK